VVDQRDDELRRLRERLDVFLQAMDTMQVGLTLTDADQRIVYVNRADAEMHGWRADELAGRPVSVFAPPEFRRRLDRLELDGLSSWQRETVNVRRDGSRFPVQLLSDVVRDADGRPQGLVTVCHDISERKLRERAFEEIHERYALAIAGSHDGIWDWDVVGGTVHYSPRWKEMVGLERHDLGRLEHWLERIHPEDRDPFRRELDEFLAGDEEHFEREHRLLHADGSYRWMLARGAVVRAPVIGAVRMVGSLTDVTERRVRDALTGLPNRLLLLDRLEHALRRQQPGRDVAVLFLDLDGFKLINDGLGHLFGDQVLSAVAERLQTTVRRSETLARLGGDEFVVVLESIGGTAEAVDVAQRVHAALEAPVVVGEKEIFVTASIGVALVAGRDVAPHDLLREADTAMYKAKARGRGETLVFDDSMRSLALEELELGNELRQALEAGELAVHYQPVFSAADRRIVGAEALVRWQHPRHGLLRPDRFLHLAEETGLIVPIGRWVLRQACRQARSWVDLLGDGHELSIGVNFSPQEISHTGFVATVREVLEETGLEPRRLRLEVTEATLILDRPTVVGKLVELREAGVVVTVDDFGTGYSSLSYLDHLPVDVLKIDRSFVFDIDRMPSRKNMVQSILRMAGELGIEVVAEGAETEAQIAELLDLRCAFFQGHALAHASPPGDVSRLLGL
jgi:diguanylate cyclase (GGDEF)-like protein/PAS domain S-box-containing protein